LGLGCNAAIRYCGHTQKQLHFAVARDLDIRRFQVAMSDALGLGWPTTSETPVKNSGTAAALLAEDPKERLLLRRCEPSPFLKRLQVSGLAEGRRSRSK
jgi:hypothetical protein